MKPPVIPQSHRTCKRIATALRQKFSKIRPISQWLYSEMSLCILSASAFVAVVSHDNAPLSQAKNCFWLFKSSQCDTFVHCDTFVALLSQCFLRALHSHITLTSKWPRWRLKSPASRLFTQPFIQTQIKENIKTPLHWPLCGEFTGTGEFPAQRASYAVNVSIWWRHHDASQCSRCDFAGIRKAAAVAFTHWFRITIAVLSQ